MITPNSNGLGKSTMEDGSRSEKRAKFVKAFKRSATIGTLVLASVLLFVGAVVVALLLLFGFPGSVKADQSRLILASQNGDVRVVKLLLKKGVDVNATNVLGFGALNGATINGHMEIVQLLIDDGADINARDYLGFSPLIWACRNGHCPLARLLLDNGAAINAKTALGDTALIYACQRGYFEVVRLLLDKGAQINATNRLGRTALDSASYGKGCSAS